MPARLLRDQPHYLPLFGLVRLVRARKCADLVDWRPSLVPEGRVGVRVNQEADDLDMTTGRRYAQRREPFVVRQVDGRVVGDQRRNDPKEWGGLPKTLARIYSLRDGISVAIR